MLLRKTRRAFGIAAFYPKSEAILFGQTSTFARVRDSVSSLEFHFCPHCGSTLYWYPAFRPEMVAVAYGAFDTPLPAPSQRMRPRAAAVHK